MYVNVLLLLSLFLSIINQCLSLNSYSIQLNDIDLNSCDNSNNVFDILSFNLWSNYLEIPGDLDVSLSFYLNRNYSTIQPTYTIKIERKLGPIWINLPCITDHCSEQSLCTLIQNSCSSINSCKKTCQLSSGSHTLEHIRIPIKPQLFEHQLFTNGQYKFKIKFYDHTKTSIGCFNGYITLRNSV
ncbi:unnamed protein product [Rotaria sp. Silwood2]|nr:unnamed protein product [Rotaria sp. Silwood2]CAF4306559.1 unnamed protein product [Rotaria sp. Silwood2]